MILVTIKHVKHGTLKMCILLVWFLERDTSIETMSSIQHCHIPVEAILNGQMTLKSQHNEINADQLCGEFLLFSF